MKKIVKIIINKNRSLKKKYKKMFIKIQVKLNPLSLIILLGNFYVDNPIEEEEDGDYDEDDLNPF